VLRSLYSGVSGLDANQEWIDTIGNDIANINTTGYKGSEIQFEDLLSQTMSGASVSSATQGGVNPTQVGLGVKVAGIEANLTQGTEEQTGNPLDLSVEGDGYFIAQGSGGATYYTRAGSLSLDGDGNLTTPDGLLVQGWPASSAGVVNTNTPIGALTIPSGQQIAANATQSLTLGGNLAAQAGWAPPGGATGTTTPVGTATSVTTYAADGSKRSLDLSFQQDATLPTGAPTGATTAWSVQGALTEPGATATYATGAGSTATLFFNAGGSLVGSTNQAGTASGPTATSFSLTVPDQSTGAAATATQKFTLSLPGMTANASTDTVSVLSQDGNAPGSLQSYNIGNNGVIQGVFSNGQTLDLGQIALATFTNPDGLMRSGDSNFTATANSGLAQVGQADNGSNGAIQAGTLEASNVDLATEMTDLIQAQNGFEANGSVISTSNTLLQALVNLKNA
jgi:flagellar hook protein FlgE